MVFDAALDILYAVQVTENWFPVVPIFRDHREPYQRTVSAPSSNVRKKAAPSRRRMFEVADDLLSGTWQSGPAFTTQSLTDNHDGTETVTVTDNATASPGDTPALGLDGSPPLS